MGCAKSFPKKFNAPNITVETASSLIYDYKRELLLVKALGIFDAVQTGFRRIHLDISQPWE